MSLSKAAILEQVRNRQISPEAGLKLFRELEQAPLPVAEPVSPLQAASEPVANRQASADIAVIGLSGQMPGAQNWQQMWTLLSEGRDAVGEVPWSRWNAARQAEGTESRKRWGAFLEDIDCFDPLFFEISPKEAEQMDPQQRLLLQESWKAFEDAGYPAEALSEKSCCVFIGCTQGDYLSETGNREINPHSLTGRSVSAMAARISYFFNLRGPSVTVNTACSSSLAALVMACERLRDGGSELGLVGGISLMSTATAHTTMDEVGMISPEGKCRTFDQDAQGIVPGEAVGVVVLKRLADALRDGDPIYGVIRGYGINHDGKTNGLTAPSGPAQTALLLDIYRHFQLDPNTLGYIEAHGTGTKLGDPIEVHALTDAFAHYGVDKRQCAIGSIKTNIGHTLEASGLMGLFKVLLCLGRQKLVPSLHFNTPNEHIAFADSPFYVNTQLRDWPRLDGQPLRAGVSSFGMSGTNAHVVVEEPPCTAAASAGGRPPHYLFVLSAKTPEALALRVAGIWQWLDEHQFDPSFSLADVAYTLQVGRSHFAYRAAIVAHDVEALQARLLVLQTHVANTTELAHQPETALGAERKLAESRLRSLAQARPDEAELIFNALADFYRQGVPLDWGLLYPAGRPRRIAALPCYPFAKQRYWLHAAASSDRPTFSRALGKHPLLHENTSDLSGQRYTAYLTGDEFFLADHLVRMDGQGLRKILPGVVYLEMARAAALAATGHDTGIDTAIRFTDIAWIQPLYVDQAQQVHIRIAGVEDNGLHYQIYTESLNPVANQAPVAVVHAEGRAEILGAVPVQPPLLDIAQLRQQTPRELGAEACYQRIRSAGVQHGECLQGIQYVALGEGQALASLSLPAAMDSQRQAYGLHPTLLDAAVQSAIGLILDATPDKAQPSLPFALEQLDILGGCEDEMLAWLRYAPGGSPADTVQKLDIDLCDRQGHVRVRMAGLSSRARGAEKPAAVPQAAFNGEAAQTIPLHALTPVWNVVPTGEHTGLMPDYRCRLLVIGATAAQMQAIRQVYPQAIHAPVSHSDSIEAISQCLKAHVFEHLVWVAPESTLAVTAKDAWLPDGGMIDAQKQGVLFLFRIIKALLATGFDELGLEWTLLTFRAQNLTQQDEADPTHAGVHGLVGSLAKEYPHWKIRLLDLDSEQDWPLQTLFALPVEPEGRALAYRQSHSEYAVRGPEWFRQSLIHVDSLQAASLYQNGGVYVVIGGAGGIGEAWSRFMIERHQAKIVWIGRREKDEAIQRRLDALPNPASASYIAADARDFAAMEKACRKIKALHPKIHGVVHSAIVLNDLSLGRMDEQRFMDSLSAKVDVSVCLARVFRKEPLDFVLFFSSMQAFSRAPGQSNYAAGCTFKDAFALKLARQWPYTFSNGSSYHKPTVKVVNWGYWGSIGIVNDDAYHNRRKDDDEGSIEPQEAMEFLSRFVASPFTQLAPFKALTAKALAQACGTEDITAYPTRLPSILDKVRQRFAESQSRLPHAQTEWRRLEEASQCPDMDALLFRLLDASLQALALREGQHSLPGYLQRWLQESLRLLNAVARPAGHAEALDRLWAEWDNAKVGWAANPNLKAAIVLIETCMKALPDILTGRLAATDVMFPNSSVELVEGIYRGNLVSDYFQQALADFLVSAIKQRLSENASASQPSPRLRILEIGAGTGGTTSVILPRLQPFAGAIEEYCYTDLSRAFLLHAQEHYAPGRPFLSMRIFNVEKPLAAQAGADTGVSADRYDFIVAANVLHATKDIRNTLRNAKAALQTNGVLLLNELSQHSLLSHLTFGLLEGWWLYEDAPLRIQGSPGLFPETWLDILGEEGFTLACLPVKNARSLGLQIIAAQSDGIVRQTRPALEIADEAATTPTTTPTATSHSQAAAFSETLLREKATDYLKQRVAHTLKMSPRQIDSSKPLEIYGIDSILVVQLANALRKDFKKISNTLFFEVQTIDALAEHFLQTQKDVLARLVGLEQGGPADNTVELSTPTFQIVGRQPFAAETNRVPSRHRDADLPLNSTVLGPAEPPPRREGRQTDFSRNLQASRQGGPSINGHSGAGKQGLNVFDVAIIGLSGRYPKAPDVDALWEQLKAGNNCVSEIPASRWEWQAYFDPQKGKAGKMYTRWGGFLDDVDCFDPLFFRISPREAEAMDPQERLFLQCAYQALQDAGYTPDNFGGDRQTGVFVGAMNSSYRGKPAHFSIANRVSYQFDFQGPSMAVDTACSASLTALHVALESLYCGSCQRAIVGGVNLILAPTHYIGLTELGMLSAGPECKSFGNGADGFIAAEGVGAVILKPLTQAIKDGDNIYAVLKGSAVNAGGRTNGYTVPNPNAQAAMVAEALRRAGISAAAVNYVEAHGTGTALGDPIEIKALAKAFESSLADGFAAHPQSCAIGSIKSNIGHCESAAGIAGLTKVLLQLQHQQLAPSLHSASLNPAIEFKDTPFVVQQGLAHWQRPRVQVNGETQYAPRTAGLSSFGAGGANAHVIIEEYIPPAWQNALQQSAQPAIVPLSAKNAERLRIVAARLLQKLRKTPVDASPRGFNLANLAYTLQVGREAMDARAGFIASSMRELEEKLDAFLAQDVGDGVAGLEDVYQSPAKTGAAASNLLHSDEDAAALLDAWMAKKKYPKLLELWTMGFTVDWNRLHQSDGVPHPHRISLPTYPFLKERYWHEESVPQPKPSPQPVRAASPPTCPDAPEQARGISFLARWDAQADAPQRVQASQQTVLIVCGESPSRLEQALAEHHRDVETILIRLASETRHVSAAEWLCGIGDTSGFASCLRGAGEIDCLYFLSLDEAEPGGLPLHALACSQERNEIQLLRLVKYLTAHNHQPHTIDTYILTLDNYALADEAVRPQGAGLTGLAYAIAQGNHRFAVRNIDLSSQDLAQPALRQTLLAAIVREPASSQGEVIKIRAGTRYRQAFYDLAWPDPAFSPIRQGGVYLILGGAGTIGRAISRHLISQYRARVIWLGRSAEQAANVQEALQAFAGFADQPSYIQADATCLDSMRQAVECVKREYPAIHGALYSALLFDADNSIDKTTEAAFRAILDVKTKGSVYFYAALENEPLDFLCYFSSGQAYAFSGAAKHSAYASGIAFSDALAQALHRRAKFPVGTINWGFWRSSFKQSPAAQNFSCLDDEEGCACFERFVFALQQPTPLSQVLCFRPSPSVLALMNYHRPTDAAAHSAAVSKITDIDEHIREIAADSFANTLKAPRENIDPNLAFAEYGLDSILGVRFVNLINDRLNIRLNTAVIFEYSSLARLTKHLIKRYRGDIAAQALPAAEPAPAIPEPRPHVAAASADIAVIGMSGKFPGALNIAEFWDKLIQGTSGIVEYPEQYLDQARYFSPAKEPGKSYCKWGGILPDRYGFDPQFFNLSPREAHAMNPHQRLVMQEGWKAFEDAGYNPARLGGSKTSVIIGAEPTGYFQGSFTGASDALVASRLSYCLNLGGPALVVNTGCSSSAVAIHLACESLRSGESDLALAGGVNACMNQDALINLSAAEMLSPRGICATFDASADGTVISEGIGVVVLKRLEDAIADGDSIDGVICGSGINQDGASNGLTAPNGLAQEQLIADIYQKFGIDAAAISYIEAHGTGTKLGDPVEANALARAFKRLTRQQACCAVGSAKSHIGHTSAAAGVIGLIKTLLSMRHRKLPPLLHFNRLNPLIEFEGSPFYINAQAAAWQAPSGAPRMAAVNSFGHSGTNAHLVVREHSPSAPVPSGRANNGQIWPVPLSAKTESSLSTLVQDYATFLERLQNGSLDQTATLAEIARTLQTGREAMRFRLVFAAETVSELAQKMLAFLDGQNVAGCWQGVAQSRNAADSPPPAPDAPVEQLAQRWCQGQALDWAASYGQPAKRVHLPTYPFANKEYGPQCQPTQQGGALPAHKDVLLAQLQAQSSDLQNTRMEALLFDLLWANLHEAGIVTWVESPEASGEIAVSSMVALAAARSPRHKIPAFYQRWLDESIQLLIDRQYLYRQDGKLFCFKQDIACLDALWDEWGREKPRWLENPNQRAQIGLVEACLRWLPAILTGQKLVTDIMFPNGSMELVEAIYQNNLVSDYFNAVLGDALVAAIQAHMQAAPGAAIRILEIGAGTGGTTRGLLRQLRPFQQVLAEYCYTDLSKVFLNHAKRHYAPGNPYLSTKLLDIDKPLAEQDVPLHHFDFAIATNVLHATGNVRRTLRHTRSALRPGGLLLINEMSDKSLFVHLTFGLLEGWWLYDDAELRIPGIPGLQPESWSRVLAEAGFARVTFPAQAEHGFGQQIIIAENSREAVAPLGDGLDGTAAQTEDAQNSIAEVLVAELAEALQMECDDIGMDESFADYGLDSLLGINFIRRLNQRLGLDLETVAIFDYNSVRKLRDYIADTHRGLRSAFAHSTVPAPKTRGDCAARRGDANTSDPAQAGAMHGQSPTVGSSATFAQEPIAIVGISGQFARSPNLDVLWENLAAGKDLVCAASRWDLSKFFSPSQLKDPDFRVDGGFMDDIDRFDPLFFKISGAEAAYMDPQQRIFLETAWSALENAGYADDSADGKPYGIFVGYGGSDYVRLFDTGTAPAQAFWGNSASVIPARIAYYLNIHGPAVTVDTACSGSLVAIHQACQALWMREIKLALAGGVSVMCTPTFYQTGTRAGMLSPTGRCRSFDETADGFIPGEGAGVVALKRLSDAVADGDHIHGVIRGSGINQDGNTNGITAPSAKSQERLERYVYDRFHIDPADIQMVEAHGTGTKLGDPIEVSALTRAFRAYTDKAEYCALGSVKTNIGHVGPVAGVAGLFKILLSMKHRKMPASLHFERANPEIRFKGSPFYVNTRLRDWHVDGGGIRCAALSSFGFSGTNAHLVIEEAPASPRRHGEKPAWLIALSGRSENVLARQAENLLAFCAQADALGEPVDLGNLSYTLLTKRKHWNHRLSCVADSLESLRRILGQWLATGRVRDVYVAQLQEDSTREQAALQRHLNECLEKCRQTPVADDYIESLSTVAELYVQGYGLDFCGMFSQSHQTLPLPTYPFARESYWVEPAAAQNRPPSVELTPSLHGGRLGNTVELSTLTYQIVGRQPFAAETNRMPSRHRDADLLLNSTALASQPTGQEAATSGQDWLFVREDWIDAPLAAGVDWKARLIQFAGKVVWAVYTDAWDREPFAQLLNQLQTAAGLSAPLQVQLIHAQGLVLDRLMPSPAVVLFLGPQASSAVQAADGDIAAVYHLSQFLMRRDWEEPVQIYYLYASDPAVPRLDCEALPGLLGTAMMENPNHAWTLIACHGLRPEVTGMQLLAQEWLADGHDAVAQKLARRESAQGAQIFQSQTFPRVRYEQSRRQINRRVQTGFNSVATPLFQAGKTYLLAGGLGLVGEEVCAELAKHYQSTLVILSRSAYDSRRQGQCERLAALGGRVHYYSVDIADRAALRQTYADVKQRLGPIHGVIHLANTVEGGLIASMDWASFQQMGAVKTQGSLHLDELTAGEPLDFFILFSSIVAFGIRGSAGYSYACAFLNQFASHRNRLKDLGQRSGSTVSLCWGPWTSDPVHASQDNQRRQKIQADGFGLISIEKAFPLLGRCPAQRLDMLAVWAVRDLAKVSRFMDVQTEGRPGQPEALSGNDWEAKIGAWEQQALQGRPLPAECLAKAINLEEIQLLEPSLIQRIHRLLFPKQDIPPAAGLAPAPAEPPLPFRPTGQETEADKLASIKAAIRDVACELLKLKELDEREAFQNYGMDSVFGVQLAIRLEKKLGREISPMWLIDFPSIQALSRRILELFAEPVEV